ncbi:MAG: hypothetical protein LC723_06145 [Actinobacteria bacterium]|nr:hypothetical protein [Actinomycetota bacterium]
MNISALHDEAMAAVDEAEAFRREGEWSQVEESLRRALGFAIQAAESSLEDASLLDQAVLHRSAASIALQLGELRESEKLIARSLASDAPEEIADELRDLLEQVHFQRHLEVRGWTLDVDEIQMSLSGKAIGLGLASSDEFVGRVKDLERLIIRTAERRSELPYRETGPAKASLKDNFDLYISVPRAASFAVTLRLGRPKEQLQFPSVTGQPGVIGEVMDLLELTQTGRFEEIQARIPDEPYRRNFIALARQLAPDGQEVSLVGLTAVATGESRRLALTVPRVEISAPPIVPVAVEARKVEVRGYLHFADATKPGSGLIKLQGDEMTHDIKVPEGMMADIVRPLWDQEVIVRGVEEGRIIFLEEIERADRPTS